jgi:branched-chain amino acid transport system permease protein
MPITNAAASPPAVVVLIPLALAAAVMWASLRWMRPDGPPAAVRAATAVRAAAGVVLVAVTMLASEGVAFRLGFVAIVFVGAIGLHILVNWSGELSLAHAGFIGVPAFAVAQLSSHTVLTPVLFFPVGVVVGVGLGLIVAVAALRTRGLQVALVTLAVGIAINQFLFVRTWVIGPPVGLEIPVPSLFGVDFRTSRSLLPVLAVFVVIAVLAARALLESKVGRALSQLRSNPDAAAAAGIPVALYRSGVYATAGAFAGLAGSMYVMWVGRVSPKAFPLNLGFNYLVIATLAGKGGLLGVALSALLLEGGRLFSILPQNLTLYLGPIALIYNVTRFQEGFNGVLRRTRKQLSDERRLRGMRSMLNTVSSWQRPERAIRLQTVLGILAVVAGFAGVALAWYHAGNTDQVWIQNQEIVSGGLGGLGLIVLGSALLVRDALLHGRAVFQRMLETPPAENGSVPRTAEPPTATRRPKASTTRKGR